MTFVTLEKVDCCKYAIMPTQKEHERTKVEFEGGEISYAKLPVQPIDDSDISKSVFSRGSFVTTKTPLNSAMEVFDLLESYTKSSGYIPMFFKILQEGIVMVTDKESTIIKFGNID